MDNGNDIIRKIVKEEQQECRFQIPKRGFKDSNPQQAKLSELFTGTYDRDRSHEMALSEVHSSSSDAAAWQLSSLEFSFPALHKQRALL